MNEIQFSNHCSDEDKLNKEERLGKGNFYKEQQEKSDTKKEKGHNRDKHRVVQTLI